MFYHSDYTKALAKLKKLLLFYCSRELNLLYVLDGVSNPHKACKDFRRRQKRESADAEILAIIEAGEIPDMSVYCRSVTITSRYIALVAGLLKHLNLPFIVAPGEADGQLAASAIDGLVISRDFDILALGAKHKVSVENGGGWHTGNASMVSLTTQTVSDGSDADQEQRGAAGVAKVFNKYGQDGLVYFGAATGCDFTPQASGILGVGPKAVVEVLLASPVPLTPFAFAACIQQNAATFPHVGEVSE